MKAPPSSVFFIVPHSGTFFTSYGIGKWQVANSETMFEMTLLKKEVPSRSTKICYAGNQKWPPNF